MLEEAERTRRGPAALEFGLAIGVLYVLARVPLLFFRQQLSHVFGGPISSPWMDDTLIRGTFLIAELMVVIVAARVCDLRSLRRQWPLMTFLGFVLLSTAWSVEPDVTGPRALMFVGTAIVGWYLGERFAARQQAFIVAAVGGAAALVSVLALVVWPDAAQSTNGYHGLWSGAYVHRNSLGLAMSTGLVALPFVLWRLRGAALAGGSAIGLLEAYLFWRSGSRTGLVALAAVAGVVGFVAVLRTGRRYGLAAPQGAVVTLVVAGATGYGLDRNWSEVVSWFGRDTSLTSRVRIWASIRQVVARHPLWGWGFEAFWSQPAAVGQAAAFSGSAHSGYYEVLLGVGRVGFALFLLFMVVTAWRVFVCAWYEPGVDGLWPFGLAVFVAVTNFSESFFVSNDAQWALLVTAGVSATRTRTPAHPSAPRATSSE